MPTACTSLLAMSLLAAAVVSGAPAAAAAPAAVTLDQVLDPIVSKLVVGQYKTEVLLTDEKTALIAHGGVRLLVFIKWVLLRVKSITGSKSYLFSWTDIESSGKTDGKVVLHFFINLEGMGPIWMSDKVEYDVCGDGDTTCSGTAGNFYRTEVADYVDVSEPAKLSVDVDLQSVLLTTESVAPSTTPSVAEPMGKCAAAPCPPATFCNASMVCDCVEGLAYDAAVHMCRQAATASAAPSTAAAADETTAVDTSTTSTTSTSTTSTSTTSTSTTSTSTTSTSTTGTTSTTEGYTDPCAQLKGSPARSFTIDSTCYYVPRGTTDAVAATRHCRRHHDEGEMANLINAKVAGIKRRLAASTYYVDVWLERVPTWQWRLDGTAQPMAEMYIDGLAVPQVCAAIQGKVGGVAPFVDLDCNAAARMLCMVRSTASCGSVTWLKRPSDMYHLSSTCFFSPPTSLPFSGVRAECSSYSGGAQLAVIDGTDDIYAEDVRPRLLPGVIYYVDLLQSHWRWMPDDIPQDPTAITQSLGSHMCADITGGTAAAVYADTNCYTLALVLCRSAFAGSRCADGGSYNRVPQSTFTVDNTCFFVPRESVTSMQANRTCAQYSTGAVAAYLNDQNVNDVRQNLLAGVRYHVALHQSTSNWFWTHTLDNLVEYPHEHFNDPSDAQFHMDGGAAPAQCALLYANGGQAADFGDTPCTAAGKILCRVDDSAVCFGLSNVEKNFIVATTTTASERVCLFVPTAASSWLEAAAGCQSVHSTAAFANLEDIDVADVRAQLTAGSTALVNMQKGNWYWGGGAHAQSAHFSLDTNAHVCGMLHGGHASAQTVASSNCYTARSVLCQVHQGPLFYGDEVDYLERSVRLGGKRFLRA